MVKITKKQLALLNDVFSWALNALEEATKDSMLLVMNDEGQMEQLDVQKKTDDIMKLAKYLQENFEIVED